MALSNVASSVHVASVTAPAPEKVESSIGDSGSSDSAKAAPAGKPKLLFYRSNGQGDPARLSRRIEQIILFTKAPPKYNNANSYTKPDFRAGILAKYFDVQTIDIEANSGAPLGDSPAVVIFDSSNERVATLSAGEILSGKLVSTMNKVLKEDGLSVYRTVIKASSVLTKVYQIEIDLQKLEKRRKTRYISEQIALNKKVKNQGLEMYKKIMSGS